MKKAFALLVVAATLVGCGDKTPVQTVEWYKEHTAERKEMLSKCESNPGELENSPNCVNARQADDQQGNARRGWVQPNAGN